MSDNFITREVVINKGQNEYNEINGSQIEENKEGEEIYSTVNSLILTDATKFDQSK